MPNYREGFLFRMESDPPALMWSGVGPITVNGEEYLGGGELMDGLPELQQLINGIADSVQFTASGVDQETIRLALEDRASVDGALVQIGTVPLDIEYQIAGPIEWEWEGIASVVTVDRTGDAEGNVSRSVSLVVGSGDTARSRSQLNFWTDAEQRRRSPDDAIFSHVAGITAGNTRRFGAK